MIFYSAHVLTYVLHESRSSSSSRRCIVYVLFLFVMLMAHPTADILSTSQSTSPARIPLALNSLIYMRPPLSSLLFPLLPSVQIKQHLCIRDTLSTTVHSVNFQLGTAKSTLHAPQKTRILHHVTYLLATDPVHRSANIVHNIGLEYLALRD